MAPFSIVYLSMDNVQNFSISSNNVFVIGGSAFIGPYTA